MSQLTKVSIKVFEHLLKCLPDAEMWNYPSIHIPVLKEYICISANLERVNDVVAQVESIQYYLFNKEKDDNFKLIWVFEGTVYV